MPAYNEAQHISNAVASVIQQSYPNWELVIADDASKDETIRIIEDLARSDSRIRLLSTPPPNGLAARARNYAMQHANGEFFAFLDADDLWKPEKLAMQIEYLNRHADVAGVCARYEYIGDPEAVALHEDLASSGSSPSRRIDPLCTKADAIRSCPFLTSSVMLRRSCYDEIGGMDEDPRLKSGQDYEYFSRLVARFTFHRMPEVLTIYRLQSAAESLSRSRQVQKKRRRMEHLMKFFLRKATTRPTRHEESVPTSTLIRQRTTCSVSTAHSGRVSFRSILTLRPPQEAMALMLLIWLPRRALMYTLKSLVSIRNRITG